MHFGTILGCFLITFWAIFSLNNWAVNKSVTSLFLHCSAVVLQLFTSSSPHLYINAVRLSLLCCLQFIRARLAWLTIATLEISTWIFSFREFHKNLYIGTEYESFLQT